MAPNAAVQPEKSFSSYADGLLDLLTTNRGTPAEVDLALDGGTAAALRSSVPLESRRASGAFLTGRRLAKRLIDGELRPHPQIVDPASGAGDLLLAAAKDLPRGPTALATLDGWGERLIGRDLDDAMVRVARLRLALLAAQLTDAPMSVSEERIECALPEVRCGDGRALTYEKPVLMLLNPPFGTVMAKKAWGSGQLPRAALFAEECFRAAPVGSSIRAILPDVLRSGSNLSRWRESVGELLSTATAERWGQFDRWTDIDVFLLRGERGSGGAEIEWWPRSEAEATISDSFWVRVGVVVPHRDAKSGPVSPYLCARDLPTKGEFQAGDKTRRHRGTRFEPPFVAIRRTSRPSETGQRLIATLVRGSEPVLAENHLIVCQPRDGTLATCRKLMRTLATAETTDWINQRIRCRHLTVTAVKEIPYEPRRMAQSGGEDREPETKKFRSS
jgi:hypothetical protein